MSVLFLFATVRSAGQKVGRGQQATIKLLSPQEKSELWFMTRSQGVYLRESQIRPSLQMDTFIIKLKYNIDALVFNLQFFYIKPD